MTWRDLRIHLGRSRRRGESRSLSFSSPRLVHRTRLVYKKMLPFCNQLETRPGCKLIEWGKVTRPHQRTHASAYMMLPELAAPHSISAKSTSDSSWKLQNNFNMLFPPESSNRTYQPIAIFETIKWSGRLFLAKRTLSPLGMQCRPTPLVSLSTLDCLPNIAIKTWTRYVGEQSRVVGGRLQLQGERRLNPKKSELTTRPVSAFK